MELKIFIIVLIIIILLTILFFDSSSNSKIPHTNGYTDKYAHIPYRGYNYDRENPNALISGKEIAGTVYSNNSENVPGLGWIN